MKYSVLAGLAFLVVSINSQAKECFDVILKSESQTFCAAEVIDRGSEIELLDIRDKYKIGLKANSRNAKDICSGTAYPNVKSFVSKKDMYNRANSLSSEDFSGYTKTVKRLYSVTCY